MPGISRISSAARTGSLPCFGNWQSVSILGRGRWSRVYRARPRDAGPQAPADYAIKVAEPVDEADSMIARQLLIREALLGRLVSHPHLTCVLASHLNQSPYYLVMPCFEGFSVESAIVEGSWPSIPHALWIARQTADAARTLHRLGWLHGDIKPDNLFLAPNGHVTLLDLGLARRADLAARPDDQPLSGTLNYLAPEAFGSVVGLGPASDLYSLGVTLYRLLTGQLPFAAQQAAELAEAHLYLAPPDPRQFNPRLNHAVARLVLKMLAKQPGQRPSADQLIAELISLEIATFDRRFAA